MIFYFISRYFQLQKQEPFLSSQFSNFPFHDTHTILYENEIIHLFIDRVGSVIKINTNKNNNVKMKNNKTRNTQWINEKLISTNTSRFYCKIDSKNDLK